MNGVTRRVLSTVVASHFLAFAGILVYTIATVDKSLLPEFNFQWIVSSAVYRWIDLFAAITLTAIALSFSLFLSSSAIRSETKGERSFVRIAGGSIVLVILVSGAFVVAYAFLYGSSLQAVEGARVHSREGVALFKAAQERVEKKEYQPALAQLNHALLLAPAYREAIDLRDKCLLELDDAHLKAARTPAALKSEQDLRFEQNARVLGYADLVQKSESYYRSGDYFSSLYYYEKAKDLSEQGSVELSELHARIENAIRGKQPDAKETERRRLYELKQAAIVGSLQNNLPVEAYYQLLDIESLAKRLAAQGVAGAGAGAKQGDYYDPDVRKWMPVVAERLARTVFFTDELGAGKVRRVSSGSLMFLNRESKAGREYVFAEQLVEGQFGYFLVKPEIVLLDDQGRIREQRKALVGKLIGHTLLLRSIDRAVGADSQEAKVLVGQFPETIKNFVTVEANVDDLWEISQGKFGYTAMPLLQQIGLLGVLQKWGYDPVNLQSTLMLAVVKVLSLGGLCFFAMGWAWKLRSQYLTMPKLQFIVMLAALPAFMYVLTSLYWIANGAIVACLLVLFGFPVSVVIVLVLQAVLLTAALVYVTGQAAE